MGSRGAVSQRCCNVAGLRDLELEPIGMAPKLPKQLRVDKLLNGPSVSGRNGHYIVVIVMAHQPSTSSHIPTYMPTHMFMHMSISADTHRHRYVMCRGCRESRQSKSIRRRDNIRNNNKNNKQQQKLNKRTQGNKP